MKTKNLIILIALLVSFTALNAQTYSDSRDQKNETAANELVQMRNTAPSGDIISSASWMHLLQYKLIKLSIKYLDNGDDGTNNRKNITHNQNRRVLPPLPGPNRHRSMNSNDNLIQK